MNHDFLSQLNPDQTKAVTFGNGPLLILAGAGSGKTRALTYRAAYLILEKKVDPSQILLVTFTNKAASEMKNRLRQLISANAVPFAGTFHSFCAKVLRREGKHIGIAANFVIFDELDQLDTVKQIMRQLNITNFKPGSILNAISGAKNELLSPSEYYSYAKSYFTKTVAQVYPAYEKLLKECNGLDFDDLLLKTVNLFLSQNDILAKYQRQLSFILVDEYQDTNKAQYELTRLLAKAHKNITVVGDCSQSIYSWRGADFRNILKLQEDFPNLTTINLERNYR